MSIKSRSAIATGDGKFIIDTVTLAAPKEGELVIKILAAGLYHTDHDSFN